MSILKNLDSNFLNMSSMREVVKLFQLEQAINLAKKNGNWVKALQLYNEIIAIKQVISNRLGLAKTYMEQGELLHIVGDKQHALQSYQKAAEIAKTAKNPEFIQIIDHQINQLR